MSYTVISSNGLFSKSISKLSNKYRLNVSGKTINLVMYETLNDGHNRFGILIYGDY